MREKSLSSARPSPALVLPQGVGGAGSDRPAPNPAGLVAAQAVGFGLDALIYFIWGARDKERQFH